MYVHRVEVGEKADGRYLAGQSGGQARRQAGGEDRLVGEFDVGQAQGFKFALEQAGEGEDPCHAGAAPERPPMDDETKETDVQRAAFESDVLHGVVMSEVLTRPSERAALRRMKRGRRA